MVRIHSETDTSQGGKHPRDVELSHSQSPPPPPPRNEEEPLTNHTQFNLGSSSEILNGSRPSNKSDTLGDKRSKVWQKQTIYKSCIPAYQCICEV